MGMSIRVGSEVSLLTLYWKMYCSPLLVVRRIVPSFLVPSGPPMVFLESQLTSLISYFCAMLATAFSLFSLLTLLLVMDKNATIRMEAMYAPKTQIFLFRELLCRASTIAMALNIKKARMNGIEITVKGVKSSAWNVMGESVFQCLAEMIVLLSFNFSIVLQVV